MRDEFPRLRRDAINKLAGLWLLPDRLRARIYRWWGMDVGDGALIAAECFFGGTDIRIGAGSYLNQRAHFDNNGPITIGERCTMGMELLVATSHHEIGPSDRRAGAITGKPVVIGDGCWIGGRVTITPGVTIGPGCVIGAGSVVTADCEADGFYAGVPAVRKLTLTTS